MPQVGIIMGSDSDLSVMAEAAAVLSALGVTTETTIVSAHRTPSRLTAEFVHREERARLLDRTKREGFVDDYSGVRITRTSRRFKIERAVVWNLIDAAGTLLGQAATFERWTPLG